MSNMKVCPLCKKDNTEDSSICVFCGFDLNPTFVADSDGIPDWLSTFREETGDNEINTKETSPNQVFDESSSETNLIGYPVLGKEKLVMKKLNQLSKKLNLIFEISRFQKVLMN